LNPFIEGLIELGTLSGQDAGADLEACLGQEVDAATRMARIWIDRADNHFGEARFEDRVRAGACSA
jgi:hypothetical protein